MSVKIFPLHSLSQYQSSYYFLIYIRRFPIIRRTQSKHFSSKYPVIVSLLAKKNIFGGCYIPYYTCSASRGIFFHFQEDKKVLRTKTKAFTKTIFKSGKPGGICLPLAADPSSPLPRGAVMRNASCAFTGRTHGLVAARSRVVARGCMYSLSSSCTRCSSAHQQVTTHNRMIRSKFALRFVLESS